MWTIESKHNYDTKAELTHKSGHKYKQKYIQTHQHHRCNEPSQPTTAAPQVTGAHPGRGQGGNDPPQKTSLQTIILLLKWCK